MRVSLTSFSVALCLLAACGGSTPPPASTVDTECVQGMPFVARVVQIQEQDEAELSSLSRSLAAARTRAEDRAILDQVAQVLAREEADLQAAPTPAEDRDLVSSLVSADESMRSAAAALGDLSPDRLSSGQAQLNAAAQSRAQAAQALQLRAEFVGGECGA